jgi:hypothetical protein
MGRRRIFPDRILTTGLEGGGVPCLFAGGRSPVPSPMAGLKMSVGAQKRRAGKNAYASSAAGRVNALGRPLLRPACEPAPSPSRKLRSASAPFASPRVARRLELIGYRIIQSEPVCLPSSWNSRCPKSRCSTVLS